MSGRELLKRKGWGSEKQGEGEKGEVNFPIFLWRKVRIQKGDLMFSEIMK